MRKYSTWAILLLTLPYYTFATSNTEIRMEEALFINRHSTLAIQEMHRTNIPASITLAQAILESNWGKSKLARQSNNFFGIKCKSDWTGQSYYHVDDDVDAYGNSIASCFRVYPTVLASFKDHSGFLQQNVRYRDLFSHKSDDFFNWAVGLQQAGYATSNDYAYKLVDLIERYGLDRFDKIPKQMPSFQPTTATPETKPHNTSMGSVEQKSIPEVIPPPAVRLPTNYNPFETNAKGTAHSPRRKEESFRLMNFR